MATDWTHGYPKNLLAEYARFFDKAYKPYVGIGPFTTPSKRGIAESLSRDGFELLKRKGEPKAMACFNVMRSASHHQDFAGRDVMIQTGDLFIKDIASETIQDASEIIHKLMQRVDAPATWIQIFQEDAGMKKLLHTLKAQHVITKMTAYGEIRALYLIADKKIDLGRRLPNKQSNPLDEITLACLEQNFLSLAQQAQIVHELTEYAQRYWKDHYSNYNEKHTWSAFALKGYDLTDPTFIIKPSEMGMKWKKENVQLLARECEWTIAAKFFPETLRALTMLGIDAQSHVQAQRVRFMRLKGGATLGRHNDNTGGDEGFDEQQIIRLHIPIRTSNAVTFHGWDSEGNHLTNHLQERGLYYMDQRKPHQVTNSDMDLERIHLVIDVHVNATVRKLFEPYLQAHAK